MEKSKELELDIQYLKDSYNKGILIYNNILSKLKNSRQQVNKRKTFIISQFKIIFGSRKYY